MKKNIRNVLLAVLFTMTPVFAKSTVLGSNTHSLVGVEVGSSNLNINVVNNDGTPAADKKMSFPHLGLKIGAESDQYRIFLSARYNKIDNFDYSYTLGIAFQYLVNFSKDANLFIGVNTGAAVMKHVDDQNFVRTIADPYFGGDIGLNYHVNETIDLELGFRYINLDAKNLKNNINYTFENITTPYVSIIYKY